MSGFPTANFSDSQLGLFSADEIRRLMRAEFDRSKRFGYPIVMLLVEIDRLDYLHDLYGVASKEAVLHGVASLLRSVTRASDFLGTLWGDRLLAVFPHTPSRAGRALSGRLLQGTRKLVFESDGRQLRATLSIGIATSEGRGEIGFDEFTDAAESALELARIEGGDRFVEATGSEPEVVSLGAALEEELAALAEERAELGRAPSAIPDLPESALRERLRELFAALDPAAPDLAALEDDVLSLVRQVRPERSATERADALSEHADRVEMLERRLGKLTSLYDEAKHEIRRLIEMQESDEGIASIYTTVQGLSDDEADLEMKKAMLSRLFEANIELRRKLRGDS